MRTLGCSPALASAGYYGVYNEIGITWQEANQTCVSAGGRLAVASRFSARKLCFGGDISGGCSGGGRGRRWPGRPAWLRCAEGMPWVRLLVGSCSVAENQLIMQAAQATCSPERGLRGYAIAMRCPHWYQCSQYARRQLVTGIAETECNAAVTAPIV